MYQNQIPTLWLHKSRLFLKDEYGVNLPHLLEVQDVCTKVIKEDNSIKPDYVIRGFYRHINHRSINQFIISPKGPDILLITGVPKGGNLDAFKWYSPKYISYWEDSNKGFLFQVFEASRYWDGYIHAPVNNTYIPTLFAHRVIKINQNGAI